MLLQEMQLDGSTLVIKLRNGLFERHEFGTVEEASDRCLFIGEALTWVGTPFRNLGDVKGANGGVDCAMLLVHAAVDSGLREPFDPRPYPPHWHLHQGKELFIGWLGERLGGVEVLTPRVGDLLVYQMGRCFSHGSILMNSEEVLHAWFAAGGCTSSMRNEALLTTIPPDKPRPVKYFDVMGRIAHV